jgi:hypothetical protein
MNFKDAAHYYSPAMTGSLKDGRSGELAYLGSHYWRVNQDALVQATGEVLLAADAGYGDQITVRAGKVLAVTGLNESTASYSLQLSELPEDSGETDSSDTGFTDTGEEGEEPPSACACTSGPTQKGTFWILAVLCLPFYRRRAILNRS